MAAVYDVAAATDAMIDAYVAWREACDRVRLAYQRWIGWEANDRRLAFAAYIAALEYEEQAAHTYERQIERVRR